MRDKDMMLIYLLFRDASHRGALEASRTEYPGAVVFLIIIKFCLIKNAYLKIYDCYLSSIFSFYISNQYSRINTMGR